MGDHEESLIASEAFETGTVVTFLTDSLLDPIPVEVVRQQMQATLEASDPPNLIVELAPIQLMGSVMLSVLIALREEASARGGTLCLVGVPDRCQPVRDRYGSPSACESFHGSTELNVQLRVHRRSGLVQYQ